MWLILRPKNQVFCCLSLSRIPPMPFFQANFQLHLPQLQPHDSAKSSEAPVSSPCSRDIESSASIPRETWLSRQEMKLTYSHTTTKKTTCTVCAGGFATTHDVSVYDAEIRTRDKWMHRRPFHKWVFCHYHYGPWTAASPIEAVVRCNNPPRPV